MKKLFILFLLTSFNCFADENINFKNYLLKGNFKKEIFREDYFWSWDFRIFDNKIFLNFEGDMADIEAPEEFPNGEYELLTENNSKIKVNVKNGKIQEFILLSNEENFKKYEENILNDYCKIAIFYSNYDIVYSDKEHKYYYVIPENGVVDLMGYKEKIISCIFDYHSCIAINGEHSYIVVDDTEGNSKNFTTTENNDKILKEVASDSNIVPDIIINNCQITYYNKKYFQF